MTQASLGRDNMWPVVINSKTAARKAAHYTLLCPLPSKV